jgi:valyl-tRNA synthetase
MLMLQERYDRSIEEKWQKWWLENDTHNFDEKALKGSSKHKTNDTKSSDRRSGHNCTGNSISSTSRTQDTEHRTLNAKPIFSIDTPPPFTSGELHMGHVLSYSFFDFAARYKRMRGFNVYYPQGWDTQGFPTEVKVEKKYGRLPAVEFRKKCVEWTHEMIARMKAQMNSMGFSPDWRYEYKTMDSDYHKKVQLSLISMYKDKLVYRAEYPVYWCPKCVSAIAKAELDDEPKSGMLNTIRFTGPNNEELLIATTRPELLPACVALLFHPGDQRYIALEGKKAKTPLGKEVPIIADKDVDKEFGTGLLMVCTFGDKMDVVWMHRHKLPMIHAIDKYGKMQNSSEFNGLKAEEAKKKMIEKLENESKVAKKEVQQQVVKIHDRCKTAVELIPSMQWFADIRTTAKKIKEMAHEVKWIPGFGITYLINWVEGAEWDWVLSRQRIFGTPLPFYYCERCNKTAAVDANELPFYPEKAKDKKCECGAGMIAESSTCDCWVDSSITPLIIAGWPDEKEKMKAVYPSSLRPQGVEIVRTWAFYTIYRSGVALTGKAPWKEILLNGNVLAPDGKKMSKSTGNIISPAELLRDYPTDAIRQWSAMSGAMAKDRPFSYEDIKYAKSFLNKLWNASRFLEAVMKKYKPDKNDAKYLNVIDRWILSRMNCLISEITELLEGYEYQPMISKIHVFFWHDFCDNYLEYVKHRVYTEEKKGGNKRRAALYCLRTVLQNTLFLLAPITPHITEEINYGLFSSNKKYKSIHLCEWPQAGRREENAEKELEVFNKIIAELRQYKASNKMAQNAELMKIRISLQKKLSAELESELKQISKIKELEMVEVKSNELVVSVQ